MSRQVVRIGEIAECIERTLKAVHDGVAQARKLGIEAELPESVPFEMVVIKDWQALEINSSESGSSDETQTGATAEIVDKTDRLNSAKTEAGTRRNEDIHIENNAENIRTTQDDE